MTEKVEPTAFASAEKENFSLTFLAQAAATDHGLTPLPAMRTYWRAFFWCMFMCIGALLWGYDSQVNSGLLGVPQFRADFGYIWHGQPFLPASWQSAISCTSYVGGTFGGLSMGSISDTLGRRGAVAFACVISILGVLIQFLSPPHANSILLVGKLINGFSLGIYLPCASGYCAEVSPLALRGIATASVNLGLVIGHFMAAGVLRGTSNWTTVYAYRLPFALQWIFPLILLIGLPFAPESPWWLVRKGRYEDAETVLILLGGPTVDAKLRRQQIRETIGLEDAYAETSTYKDCFKGENLKRTVVAMMIFVLQHSTGIVFVFGYSSYFFELAGFSTSKAFDLSMGGNALGLVGTLLACYVVNRVGRRFLFNWGMAACTVIMFSIGFIWIGNTHKSAKWAVSAFMMIYNFVFQFSAPAGFVIFAEVASSKLRSKTVGLGMWTNSLCNVLGNIIVPYLVNPDEANLGGYTGFIYGGLSLVGSFFAYFLIPETKGRTVDELDLLYEKRVPARHFGTHPVYISDAHSI